MGVLATEEDEAIVTTGPVAESDSQPDRNAPNKNRETLKKGLVAKRGIKKLQFKLEYAQYILNIYVIAVKR